MRYIPNTAEDRAEMLRSIGVKSADDLFADIPEAIRFRGTLDVPPAVAEFPLMRHLNEMAGKNADLSRYACFLGAGAYDHWVPTVVNHVLLRNEFYTSYTPYQPEISQGFLQAIYEYQSLICELMQLDVANASMYECGSAVAEAATLACRQTRRDRVVVSRAVHPEYRQVLRTYVQAMGIEIVETGYGEDGETDLAALAREVDDRTSAVIIQTPNFFGVVEDGAQAAEIAHGKGALLVAAVDPISLGLLEPPGAYGADIAVAEGQSLGNFISFGGPYLGVFATTEALLRQLPGRLVGATVDNRGQRGFVLTLSTREQHIRREKATSNICTNQALNALAATVYLTVLGRQGIREVAEHCLHKAHYAAERFEAAGASRTFGGPFFKEFAIQVPGTVSGLNRVLLDRRMIGGLDLARYYPELAGSMLVAVTEKRTREEIDAFAEALSGKGAA